MRSKEIVMERIKELIDRLKVSIGESNEEIEYKDDKILKKSLGPIRPGNQVEIKWGHDWDNIVDRGYIFTLPGFEESDAEMGGIVHIPEPSCTGGDKDAPHPEWHTLADLTINPKVESIIIK
jgi:hypothetical protein